MIPTPEPHVAPQARVWITEFVVMHTVAAAPFAQLPALRKHPPLDLSDGLAHTADLDPTARYIRIISEVQCAFSTTGEATTNDILLPRLTIEYYGIDASSTSLSVIAAP